MKIWLRLIYANGDVAATLVRPWRWSYTFVTPLYPFYIESEILEGHRFLLCAEKINLNADATNKQ